jgi:hypothetical protein
MSLMDENDARKHVPSCSESLLTRSRTVNPTIM